MNDELEEFDAPGLFFKIIIRQNNHVCMSEDLMFPKQNPSF